MSDRRTSSVVVDAYIPGRSEVAGIGVAFRGGRIICGDVVRAPDLLTAELLAVLRALEVSSRVGWCDTIVYTDLEVAESIANGEWTYRSPAAEIQRLLALHPFLSVRWGPKEATKAARIVARQIFKAWHCAFEASEVTWSPVDLKLAVA